MIYMVYMQTAEELRELLHWYVSAGVDEVIGDEAADHFQPPALPIISSEALNLQASRGEQPTDQPPNLHAYRPMNTQAPLTNGTIVTPSAAMKTAKEIAARVTSIAELKEAVEGFEGCLLKRTATHTVFADGADSAEVMVIGEAPGEQEDLSGIPFCGKSGQLLDNVLKSIGLTRAKNVYISNTIFWRPPGNRTPSPEEVAICAPLVKKHIALKQPKLVILAGGVASSVLQTKDSVSKMRGKFHEYSNEYMDAPTKAVVIYHPSFLLRQPGQKAQAWRDMLMIQEFLEQ